MLNNDTKEQNEDKKIANSSKNQINESDGLTIMTKTKTDIHHLAMNKNNEEIKNYIDSLCIDMFSPWKPKLLMDVFILTDHIEKYDIIKHINEDCLHTIYFDPQKYPVTDKFQGEGYSLLCKDLATSSINHGYQIARNVFYVVGGLTANRFSCSRCIQYIGDIKCRQATPFRAKTFHNDAINT